MTDGTTRRLLLCFFSSGFRYWRTPPPPRVLGAARVRVAVHSEASGKMPSIVTEDMFRDMIAALDTNEDGVVTKVRARLRGTATLPQRPTYVHAHVDMRMCM